MEVDARAAPVPPCHRDATLRISQVVSACTFCKSRKIKCDGQAPACGCCTKFGRAASCSLADSSARHVHDYVAYLQGRISEAQVSLAAAHAEARSPSAPPIRTAPTPLPPTPIAPAFDFNSGDCSADLPALARGHHPPRKPLRPAGALGGTGGPSSAIDTLIADIGALPISTSSHAHVASVPATNSPTLSTVLLAAASKLPLLSIVQDQDGQTRPDVAACLPEEAAARKLALHYIQQVYPRLPFFSIQGFWAQFQHVYGPTAGQTDDSTGSAGGPGGTLHFGYSYFTVLLVLAIATSSLSRSADSMISNQALRLFQAGLQFRESAILPNTIVGVQSLLFLIQFATLNPSVLDSWYLIGVGMRNCVDLGLHQDPYEGPRAPPVRPSLLETRRRLWWSMYSFDRSLSIGCGRPTEIADALIHVQLPSFRIESSASDVEIEGYVQRYRALQLQSEIYDALNHPPPDDDTATATAAVVADLRQKMDAWQQDNRPERNRETLADSEWLMSKMLLCRPCRLLPRRSIPELSELWLAACGFTAQYRELVETNGIFYVQVACEKVYWTGLAMLYSYWKLRGVGVTAVPAADGSPRPDLLQPLHLWKATKDTAFILQTLSERWEDGKILSAKFDVASARVLELLDGQGPVDNLEEQLPSDVVTLAGYASLVSIWASGQEHLRGGLGAAHSEELQDLVAKMI